MKHSGIDWDAVKASLAVLGISLLVIAVVIGLTIIGVKSWQAGLRWPAFVEGALVFIGMFLYGYYQLKDL
jgi:FtsH-binding integral membrane protein